MFGVCPCAEGWWLSEAAPRGDCIACILYLSMVRVTMASPDGERSPLTYLPIGLAVNSIRPRRTHTSVDIGENRPGETSDRHLRR